MGWTRVNLAMDLRELGVSPGDRLAVHSSMKAIGWVDGGTDEVLQALFDVVGPEGTILMPTMSAPMDRFDVASEPSRTGALTEALRNRPDSIRSLHPTHSAAVWGKDAQTIADGHLTAGALSADSPFHRLAKRGGKVLLLGVDSRRNSLIHVAEAIFGAPYVEPVFWPGYDRDTVMILPDGRETTIAPRENPGCSHNFNVVQDELQRRGRLVTGKVGNATAHLMLGNDVLQAAMDMLREDVGSLLCHGPDCPFCPRAREHCV